LTASFHNVGLHVCPSCSLVGTKIGRLARFLSANETKQEKIARFQ
jgi:hypothetical protein